MANILVLFLFYFFYEDEHFIEWNPIHTADRNVRSHNEDFFFFYSIQKRNRINARCIMTRFI